LLKFTLNNPKKGDYVMDTEHVARDYLFERATVAIIGASPKEERPSIQIVEYLDHNGMKVFLSRARS